MATAQQTIEYETLLKNEGKLTNLFRTSISSFVNELYTNGLITQEVFETETDNNADAKKAKEMTICVLECVRKDPGKYRVFMSMKAFELPWAKIVHEHLTQDFGDIVARISDEAMEEKYGPPSPVKDLKISNNLEDCTVTFMWTYDNAVNTIPATSFNVTVTPVNGGNPITETASIDNHSLTLPLSQLVSEESYRVSVVATNQLGESDVIENTFTSPGEPKYTGKDLVDIAMSKHPIPAADDLRESLVAFMSKVVVLLHTVKDEEMIAALKNLSSPVEQSDKPIRWFHGNASFILGIFGGHKAALVQTSKGADCQPELMPALRSLPNAQLIITLGFAYGLKSKCNLGDVLVSTSVDGIGNIRLEHGTLKFDEGRVRQTSMSTRALIVFTKGITLWRKFRCSTKGRKTKVIAGPLISSPVLLNDKAALDEYLKNNERIKGGEMEGQDVARTLLTLKEQDRRDIDFIVIKGVADFGDGSKDKGWQLTASLAAASYAEDKLRESGGRVYNCDDHPSEESSSEDEGASDITGLVARIKYYDDDSLICEVRLDNEYINDHLTYKWYENDTEILREKHEQLEQQKAMFMSEPKYKCVVVYKGGNTSIEATSNTLTVKRKNIIAMIEECSDGKLICIVEKDNKRINDGLKYQWCDGENRLEGETDEKLGNNPVSFESKQKYRCEVLYRALNWDPDVHVKVISDTLNRQLDLRNLKIELKTVTNWYSLGIQLNVPDYELRKIDQDFHGSDHKMSAMLSHWLNNCSEDKLSWQTIADALKHIHHNNLARKLERYILGARNMYPGLVARIKYYDDDSLICEVTLDNESINEDLEYKWFENNTEILREKHEQLQQQRAMFMSEPKYKCVVVYKRGNTSIKTTSNTLIVKRKNIIAMIEECSDGKLLCIVEKNNERINDGLKYQWCEGEKRLEGETDEKLGHNPVSFESKQKYRCEVLYRALNWDPDVYVKVISDTLNRRVENMEHYEAYEQALKDGSNLAMTYLKLILFGTPRSGKSSTRRRLLKEIKNLYESGKNNSKSTGAAESTEVIIRQELTSIPCLLDRSDKKWLPLKGTQNSTEIDQNLDQWEGDLSLLAKVFFSLMLNNKSSEENVSDDNTTDSILNSDVSITTDLKSDSNESDIPDSDTHHLFDSTIGSDRDLNQEPEPNIELQSVNKAFNELKSILLNHNPKDFQRMIENLSMVNLIDVGSQSAFLEMLPMLTVGSALYLLFFRMDQDLEAHHQVKWCEDESSKDTPLKDNYCTKDVLCQGLSAVACFGSNQLIRTRSTGTQPINAPPTATEIRSSDSQPPFFRSTDTQPIDTQPNDTDTRPSDTQPSDTQPTDTQPSDTQPSDTQPNDTQPIDTQPSDTRPSDIQPSDTQPNAIQPSRTVQSNINCALLVGTYKDEVKANDLEKCVSNINRLWKELNEIKVDGKSLLLRADDNDNFFQIDNMYGNENLLYPMRTRIENIIYNHEKHIFPPSWLMFRIILSLMKEPVVTLKQCEAVANRLEMCGTMKNALWFLHHHVGCVMYYPEIESLKDIVICNPQAVFDCISKMIIQKFRFANEVPGVEVEEKEEFKRTGKFTLKHILLGNDKLCLTPNQLIDLLKHKHIIAELEAEKYMMPAVLGSAPEQELQLSMPVLRSAAEEELQLSMPLLIQFECGFVPYGMFCATVSNLIADHKWRISSENAMKNKVEFIYEASYIIKFISQPLYLGIQVAAAQGATKHRKPLKEVCSHVKQVIDKSLRKVVSLMKYETVLRPSQKVPFNYAFTCAINPIYLMKVKDEDDGHGICKCHGREDIKHDLNEMHTMWFENKEVSYCGDMKFITYLSKLKKEKGLYGYTTIKEALEECVGHELKQKYVKKLMKTVGVHFDFNDAVVNSPSENQVGKSKEVSSPRIKFENPENVKTLKHIEIPTKYIKSNELWNEKTYGWSVSSTVGADKYATGSVTAGYHSGRSITKKNMKSFEYSYTHELDHEMEPLSKYEATVFVDETQYTAEVEGLWFIFPTDTKLRTKRVKRRKLLKIFKDNEIDVSEIDIKGVKFAKVRINGKFEARVLSVYPEVYNSSPLKYP